MSLREYRRKRDFGATPEPAGGGAQGRRIFVVQLHHASHRHFDFRLELDGVLKSWAVPKGPSFDPAVKRLAMEVEDHPIAYATFEGDIPHGHYGAGHVDVFDHGTWEPLGDAREGLAKGELKFVLHGDVLRGSWVLVRTHGRGAKPQWLLIKHEDEFAGPRDANAFVDPQSDRPLPPAQRKAVWARAQPARAAARAATAPPLDGARAAPIENEAFTPELCRSQREPPDGDGWIHEIKWDGYRLVATVVGGEVRLWSRNAIEWTDRVPEIARAVASLKLDSAQLDGEMLVLRGGRDDFNALQARLAGEAKDALVYMLFDLPYLNGMSLRDVPLVERKAALAALLKKHTGGVLRYSEHQVGGGRDAFAQAVAGGLEGIISKRANSGYRGARNGDWIKTKARPSDEFVVVGYTEPKGQRSHIGALLLARAEQGRLVYAGRVGTGFSEEQLRGLLRELKSSVVREPTAERIDLMEPRDQRLAIWVRPTRVVEVFHQGIGGQGLLRQVAFKTFREDKTPADLLAESTGAAKATKTAKSAKSAAAAAKPSARAATRAAVQARPPAASRGAQAAAAAGGADSRARPAKTTRAAKSATSTRTATAPANARATPKKARRATAEARPPAARTGAAARVGAARETRGAQPARAAGSA
ncbi:MAG TPA: non-homologous end-joining DNA ligase, partial [Dokdonella sp.]